MNDEHVTSDFAGEDQDSTAGRETNRSKKYSRRRFSPETAPKILKDSGCDPSVWPTKYQYKRWFKYVIKSLPADPDGAWFAVCPINNNFMPAGNIRKPTAIINFRHSVFRCLHEDPCHGGARAMAINRMDQRLLELLDDGTMAKVISEELSRQKNSKTDDS